MIKIALKRGAVEICTVLEVIRKKLRDLKTSEDTVMLEFRTNYTDFGKLCRFQDTTVIAL